MLIAIIAAAGIVVLAHTAPFPFVFDAFSGDLTMWRAPHDPSQRIVYLTFDDGPNPAATPMLLDLLREKGVHATFFLIDEHVTPETAPLVRRMFEEGHAVAQHSGDRWLMLHSSSSLASKLTAAAGRIEQLAGHRPCPIFRPHAGWRSIPMLRGLNRMGYKLAGWTWMSFDFVWFRKRTPERVSNQVIGHAKPGQIIVLHDGHHIDPRPDRDYAIGATRRIIDALRAEGYEFAPLCP